MKRTMSRHCRMKSYVAADGFVNNFEFSFNGRFRYYHEFVYILYFVLFLLHPPTPNVIVNYPDFRLLFMRFCLFLFISLLVDIFKRVKTKKKSISIQVQLMVCWLVNDKVDVPLAHTHAQSWMMPEF